jgi:hypothetical protein
MVKTKHTRTFLDLLNLVEGRLKELLPQIKGAVEIIKEDFKSADPLTFHRIHGCINDLDDFIGHLDYLRNARNSADDVTISIPLDLANRAETAAEDVQTALDDAACVLKGLENSITSGYVNGDDHFILATMQLTSRALLDMSEREAATTRHVASLIRQELGARASANLAKAA